MPPISLEPPPEQLALPAPSVGIIYPPPEVRNIVDKTAGFVARNGPEFEQRIKQNEVNNPKFNFLSPGDPYHAYYEHRVEQIREGKDDEPAEKAKPAGGEAKAAATDAMKQRQSELLKQAQKEQVSNLITSTLYELQGDNYTCSKPPVDFKPKVPLWPDLSCPGQAKMEVVF